MPLDAVGQGAEPDDAGRPGRPWSEACRRTRRTDRSVGQIDPVPRGWRSVGRLPRISEISCGVRVASVRDTSSAIS